MNNHFFSVSDMISPSTAHSKSKKYTNRVHFEKTIAKQGLGFKTNSHLTQKKKISVYVTCLLFTAHGVVAQSVLW